MEAGAPPAPWWASNAKPPFQEAHMARLLALASAALIVVFGVIAHTDGNIASI